MNPNSSGNTSGTTLADPACTTFRILGRAEGVFNGPAEDVAITDHEVFDANGGPGHLTPDVNGVYSTAAGNIVLTTFWSNQTQGQVAANVAYETWTIGCP